YLHNIYSKSKPLYNENEISYTVAGREYFTKDEDFFHSLAKEYDLTCNSDGIQQFAHLTLNIYNGQRKVMNFSAYVIQKGEKWFFFKS
ncbi:MAG: hypothetical protein RR246_01800, partial [Clostridia bacterium]